MTHADHSAGLVDEFLRAGHEALVANFAEILDVEAGLREVFDKLGFDSTPRRPIHYQVGFCWPGLADNRRIRLTDEDEPAPDFSAHQAYMRQCMDHYNFVAGQVPPLTNSDWFGPLRKSEKSFPTPDEVDDAWERRMSVQYDQLRSLVEKQMKEQPTSQGTYSVDIPLDTVQPIVDRVKAELTDSGWAAIQDNGSKGRSRINFWRPGV